MSLGRKHMGKFHHGVYQLLSYRPLKHQGNYERGGNVIDLLCNIIYSSLPLKPLVKEVATNKATIFFFLDQKLVNKERACTTLPSIWRAWCTIRHRSSEVFDDLPVCKELLILKFLLKVPVMGIGGRSDQGMGGWGYSSASRSLSVSWHCMMCAHNQYHSIRAVSIHGGDLGYKQFFTSDQRSQLGYVTSSTSLPLPPQPLCLLYLLE